MVETGTQPDPHSKLKHFPQHDDEMNDPIKGANFPDKALSQSK